MNYPPSLSQKIKVQAFQAPNGELGILPSDVPEFLDACRTDGVEMLGWELWVVDHEWNFETGLPTPCLGVWMGGIPLRGQSVSAIVHGETAEELSAFDLDGEIESAWLPHVRVNFTLDD